MKIGISLGGSRLGGLVMDALQGLGVPASDLVAVARSPEKIADRAAAGVDVRQAAYGDTDEFIAALQGVDRLYMISGMAGPSDRRIQHRRVIDAAQRAGVQRIVYTSFIDTADNSPFFAWKINRDTEAFLGVSGMPFTVLRHGMYSEADLEHIDQYVEAGKVANNIGPDGRISYISRSDLALAGAHALVDDGHEGATYELTGPEAVSQPELAALISEWSGATIPYETVPDREYAASFAEPAWAKIVVDLYASVRKGNCAVVTDDFAKLAGRPPLTLRQTYDQFFRGP